LARIAAHSGISPVPGPSRSRIGPHSACFRDLAATALPSVGFRPAAGAGGPAGRCGRRQGQAPPPPTAGEIIQWGACAPPYPLLARIAAHSGTSPVPGPSRSRIGPHSACFRDLAATALPSVGFRPAAGAGGRAGGAAGARVKPHPLRQRAKSYNEGACAPPYPLLARIAAHSGISAVPGPSRSRIGPHSACFRDLAATALPSVGFRPAAGAGGRAGGAAGARVKPHPLRQRAKSYNEGACAPPYPLLARIAAHSGTSAVPGPSRSRIGPHSASFRDLTAAALPSVGSRPVSPGRAHHRATQQAPLRIPHEPRPQPA
jgi:hypothetical protein